MYNTVSYIFLKFACPICKKAKTFPDKNKSIFSKPNIWLVQLKEGFWVSSVQTYLNWWSQNPTMTVNYFKKNIILLFNYAFMIRSMITLITILFPNFSMLGFKFKTGLHDTIYHLSLATCRREWFLRMIFLVCLLNNAHGINQQHKLKPKIKFDRSFLVICCLCKLQDSGALF